MIHRHLFLYLFVCTGLTLGAQTRFLRIPLPEPADAALALLPPQALPWTDYTPFLALSLEWADDRSRSAEDGPSWRFQNIEGEWGPWLAIRPDPHAGEAGVREFGMQHYLDPGHQAVQLRLPDGAAAWKNLVLHAFDPGPSGPEGTPARPPAEWRDAPCQCLSPDLLSRQQWCPDGSCLPHPNPEFTVPTHLIIHHSAGTNSSSDWRAVVRSIWSYHVNSNGWSDIGYNFLIDPLGIIYEGRGDGVVGAHFCGKNGATLGTCVLGDFTQITPTTAARDALAGLYAWKSCAETIDPLGSAPHGPTQAPLARVAGHRDGCNTACPGNAFYPLLPAVRQDILQRIGADCTCALQPPADLQVESSPGGSRLTWTPLPDTGLLYIIDRRHPDEALFQVAGESVTAVWTDPSALPGIAYRYRVRAKSAWCLSEPGMAAVLPQEEEEGAWQVRPTLTEGPLRIMTNRREQGLVRMQLYDALGRQLWAAAPWKPEGAWSHGLDLSAWPAGVYILRLRYAGEEHVVRIVRVG